MITASLRATATRALLIPTRLASRVPHAFRVDHLLTRVSNVPAASNRYVLVKPSPHFEMRPAWSTSPDWYRRGVRPRYAPTPERAREPLWTVNGCHEGDRSQRPNAGNRHQPPASVAALGEGKDPCLERSDLLVDQIADGQQRVHRRLQPRLASDELAHPVRVGALAELAHYQAERLEQPSDLGCQVATHVHELRTGR
jgi:hypothetical protein